MSRRLASNSAVAMGVALLHLAAIVMLNRARLTIPSESRELHGELTFIEVPVPNKRKVLPASAPKLPRIPLPRLPEDSISTAISVPAVDWHEQGTQSAAAIARDLDRQPYRSLDASPNHTQHERERETSVFRKPLHRAGETQNVGNGEIITWTDDRNGRCYVTNQGAATASLDANAVVTVCKHRKEPTRDDLFDAMKPSYLKEPGEKIKP